MTTSILSSHSDNVNPNNKDFPQLKEAGHVNCIIENSIVEVPDLINTNQTFFENFQDDIKENEHCMLSTRSDSAIDVSTLSSTTLNHQVHHCCNCSCHQQNKILQTFPARRKLQISVSMPICKDGTYADPVQILTRNRWLVCYSHPRNVMTETTRNELNVNNCNNHGQAASMNKVSVVTVSESVQPTSSRTKALRSSCLHNKKLCTVSFIMIVLTLIAVGVLVYVNFLSNSNETVETVKAQFKKKFYPENEREKHVKAPPYNSSFVLLNQTLLCGSIPPKYLPAGRYLPPDPVYVLRTNFEDVMKQNEPDVQPRIIGGSPTNIASYPWQASLYVEKSTKSRLVCGASIILKNWLITASHCMKEESDIKKWSAFCGMSVLSNRNSLSAVKRKINRFFSHPDYSGSSFEYDYDITLLQLDQELIFSQFIQPICLPVQDYHFPDNIPCHVSGWGLTNNEGKLPHSNVLQHTQVDIINSRVCNSSDWLRGHVTERMICAGKVEGKRDSCQGDSGGPLSCKPFDNETIVLAGSVSWGVDCGSPKRPGVYTKISYFIDWIWKKIGTNKK